MPHGFQIQQDATKLNSHGVASINHGNKFQQSNEYYSIIADPTVVQIQSGLDDSNLTSLANQQLSKNTLWSPVNEYDLRTSELDRPAMLSSVASQIGLGSLVNFQNTILGRFIGVGPKTPMIEIANSRLVLEFSRRVASTLAKNLLPTINIGGFLLGKLGLGKEEPLIRPAQEYIITKLPFGERDTAYYVGLFTGFESNKNPLDGITENKEILKRTSSGQVSLLKQNLEQNIFRPTDSGDGIGGFLSKILKNSKIGKFLGIKQDPTKDTQKTPPGSYDPENYVPTDMTNKYEVINDPNFKGIGNLLPPQITLENSLDFPEDYQVDDFFKQGIDHSLLVSSNDIKGWEFERGKENNGATKRGILKFTQDIVDSGHAVGRRIDQKTGGRGGNEPFEKTRDGKKKLAKGRNLGVGFLNEFCRTWIKTDQYDSYKKLIRHEKHYLKRDGNLSDLNTKSVLSDIGMPRIHPVSVTKENFKPMMFSLENLAWSSEDILALPGCERGPNDGRIMWFPPYGIEIDENISASWEKTDIIGRGEPIYTYNNSERTLNFQFKLIVDYPSNLKSNLDSVRNDADKFFAGCEELSPGSAKPMSQDGLNKLEVEKEKLSKLLQQPETNLTLNYTGPGKSESSPIKFYFQHSNNVIQTFDTGYESGSGLKNEKTETDAIEMVQFLINDSNSKYFDLNIVGHTSKPTNNDIKDFNKTLSINRANSVKSFIAGLGIDFEKKDNINSVKTDGVGDEGAGGKVTATQTDIDSEEQKEARRVDVWLVANFDSHLDTQSIILDPIEKENTIKELDIIEKQLSEQRKGGFIGGECLYFKELEEKDPFVFSSYSKKIDYFHPAFHSQTPEDFNKRLVFLQQSTRQGKPFSDSDAKNSVFGRMPVCVLRLGDFFNCRIIINNIGFSYEPLLWDLNPEGSGIQPMLCNVNVNCNIIGGSNLKEPITQLQNALSSKFYANHDDKIDKELIIEERLRNGLDVASGMGPVNKK